MNTIVIKDLANAMDVHVLSRKEMELIKGGQQADIGGWSALGEVVGTVLAPIDFDAMKKWAQQQAGK